jgi:chromosomal replication initiation ATPase DnaA
VSVCVPNTFTKSWLEKKYHLEIVKTLERVTGKPVKKVEILQNRMQKANTFRRGKISPRKPANGTNKP